MSAVQFFGTIDRWTLGEPPRLELVSRPNDNAVAQSLALLKQRILTVTVHEGAREEEFCSLTATLPPIQSSVGKAGKGTRVKLDIDPRETTTLLSLLSLGDKSLRFVFTDGGGIEVKPKREPKAKPEPTPYGAFWRELDKTGFHNRPDVRDWIDYTGTDEGIAKDRIREKLGVEKRSLEASPNKLIAALQQGQEFFRYLAGAITAVEEAKARTQLQEVA